MIIPSDKFLESADILQGYGASAEVGKATITYQLGTEEEPAETQDLLDLIPFFTGSVQIDPKDKTGQLFRTNPIAHPIFDSWFCVNLPSVKPKAVVPEMRSNEDEIQMKNWSLYSVYDVVAEFAPLTYDIKSDSEITVTNSSWVDENNAAQQLTYANEWIRNTDYDILPITDGWITAKHGQMIFSTGSGSAPGAGGGTPFSGMPRMMLPDSIIKYRWLRVPYRYITSSSSILNTMKGRVNQSTWNGYAPGSLLYMGYEVTKWSQVASWFNGDYQGKECNITFSFLHTARTGTDLPTPSNSNHIASGWNLMPFYQTRKFYYVKDSATSVPPYLSFRFEQLFTDPDL